MVACQQQLAAAAVVDRKGEHAVQPARKIRAVLLIGVDDHLGVGIRGEAVALGLQFGTELDRRTVNWAVTPGVLDTGRMLRCAGRLIRHLASRRSPTDGTADDPVTDGGEIEYLFFGAPFFSVHQQSTFGPMGHRHHACDPGIVSVRMSDSPQRFGDPGSSASFAECPAGPRCAGPREFSVQNESDRGPVFVATTEILCAYRLAVPTGSRL